MNPGHKHLLVPVIFVAVATPMTATATNGYFLHATGIKERGLAGAGVAHSRDMLAAATNPANVVFQGTGFDVGAALFNPERSYSAQGISAPGGTPLAAIPGCPPACPFSVGDGDQSLDSDNTLFVIPQFAYNWALDTESSVGVAVYAHGGLSTNYDGGVAVLPAPAALGGPDTLVELPGTAGDGDIRSDFRQLMISTTYSAKFSETGAWGASLLLAYQTLEVEGVASFAGFSSDPTHLTDQGRDSSSGLGIRLGIQGEVAPGVKLGGAWQPQIGMSQFDDYSGLLAEDGDFDIPETLVAGIAWDVTEAGTLLFDVQRINYEDVPAIANSVDSLVDGSCIPFAAPGFGGFGAGCMGGSQGAGFGWENMTVFKLGYRWRTGGGWTWRVGYSQTDQPIPASEQLFNIFTPGVIEEHFTFGFTKRIGDGELNFAALFAPGNSVTGDNVLDPAQEIENEMEQIELAIGYTGRFE